MSKSNPTNGNNINELPLLGKKILVTRPNEQGKNFAIKLEELGAKTILMPMIEISDPDSWQQLDAAIETINSYQWLLFASSNAVIAFVKRLAHKQQINWQSLDEQAKILPERIAKTLPKIAVIGAITAKTAQEYGLKVTYCPNNYLAEDFIAQFPGYPKDLANIKILWPRTNTGRDLIIEKLQEAQAIVNVVSAYKSNFPSKAQQLNERLQDLIKNKQIDAIILASKQSAINLAKILEFKTMPEDISRNLLSACPSKEALLYLKDILSDILIVTIGPEASEGALNYLGKVNIEASSHTAEGIIAGLIEHYSLNECSNKSSDKYSSNKFLTNPK